MKRDRALPAFVSALALLAAGSVPPQPSASAVPADPAAPADPPARALLLELTQTPRLAGTIGSVVGARFVARVLEDAGFEVEIDEREVLLSLPRTIELAIHEDAFSETPLSERIERFDPDAIPPGDVPMCNGWSASGEVRARVVDAGRGLRADFERLKSLGVETRGAVALIRYGGSYRGIKVDFATQAGCAAVLLFSDPKEDGPDRGPTWPAGPWKPDWDAQRGSINPIARTPGDPSTPGWPSPRPGTKGAERASAEAIAAALPTIPCVPIGWREAKVLIERLAKVEVTGADGAKSQEPLGPGPVQVRLEVDQPRDYRTIRNVIARLPGERQQTVFAGAHRDSWVRGANDDGAGTVAMLRAAQHLGERRKSGWKPKSTIAFAFWDAEEFGLIGSTEWAEANAEWLRENALAYVNADTGVNGPRFRGAGGSPGMLAVLRAVAERTPAAPRADGETPGTLWDEWKAAVAERAKRGGEIDGRTEPSLSLPGSGSDFAVFVHHLSVPCLEPSFGGGAGGGAYHTSFDDFAYVEKYVDPGFVGHELAGRFYADLLAEIADRPDAFDEAEAARDLARRARDAGANGTLGESLASVAQALEDLAGRLGDGTNGAGVLERPFYRALELEGGIPGRGWFRNRLWAPALENGYGSETFPTLRAAATAGDEALREATQELVRGVEALAPAR